MGLFCQVLNHPSIYDILCIINYFAYLCKKIKL